MLEKRHVKGTNRVLIIRDVNGWDDLWVSKMF